jgi:hypothetical protein
MGLNQVDLSVEEDTMPTPQMNIVKSVIDTLISKIASTKVRPYFTPINGDYTTIKVLKQLQVYFDDLFDRQDINRKITEAKRDACIFDKGDILINPITLEVEKLAPWQVAFLDAELHYGRPTKALIKYEDYPETTLKEKYGIDATAPYSTVELYFDTVERKIGIYVNQALKKEINYNAPIPIIELYYSTPIKGGKTTSIVDDLYNIQLNIDLINARIKEAANLTPANMIAVPDGSNINVEMINNRAGNVFKYKPIPGLTRPIEVVTPAFIAPEYQALLEYYINKAYEMVGISTLSAQSINPLGANASGAALQSMENIESTRFETQLNQVVRAYTDVAKMMIAVMPDDADILPDAANRTGYKWRDVKKQIELINVQYSGQTLLSKDPSTRLQQILQLSQVGLIPQSKLGRFFDMPDMNEVYTIMTAAQDAVDKVIQLAVDDGVYDIPKFVSYALLEESITAMQNQLMGVWAPKDKETTQSLERLQELDDVLQEIMIREGFTAVQPTGPIQAAENGMAAAGMVEAPSSVDLGVPPGAANEKDTAGDIGNQPARA